MNKVWVVYGLNFDNDIAQLMSGHTTEDKAKQAVADLKEAKKNARGMMSVLSYHDSYDYESLEIED